MDKTKIIKAEITIPTAPYANIKPTIDIDVPENLSGVALAQYLWDTFNGLFEKELKKEIIPCVKCGEPLRIIPAGFSKKTNQKYEQFAVCKNKCPQYEREVYPEAGLSEEDEKVMKERGNGTTKLNNTNEVF